MSLADCRNNGLNEMSGCRGHSDTVAAKRLGRRVAGKATNLKFLAATKWQGELAWGFSQ